jgi:hypothetical protein
LEVDMNRKSPSPFGTAGRAKSDALLGFSVWITPFQGITPAVFAALQRKVEDYLIDRDLRDGGTPLQLLIWSDERSLSATDQVDLLVWLLAQPGIAKVEVGPLVAHGRPTGERGTQPVVVARFGDLDLVPMAWLYGSNRVSAEQFIQMLGGFRSTATLH